MIRYFAATDDSATGRMALEYLNGMLLISQVRVLSMSGGMHGPWERYASLLMTPMTNHYVNVVCCEPIMWVRTHRIQAPLKAGGYETIISRTELYTVGVRNVLIAGAPSPNPFPFRDPRPLIQVTTAERYELVIVPGTAEQDAWNGEGVPTSIIHSVDHNALRAAILL